MDRVLVVLLLVDLLFLGTGGLLVGAAVRTKNQLDSEPTLDNVAANLLLARTPWVGTSHPASLDGHDAEGTMASTDRVV